jgi:hypothetical protein
MKDILGNLAGGQIEFYKAVRDSSVLAPGVATDLRASGSRQWKSGSELYPLSNVYALMFSG